METTQPTRSVESLSMFNPLRYDDLLELDGPEGGELWQVNRSGAGWYLHEPGNKASRHSKIHSIDGMSDFISAILEWAKGYA